MTIERRRACRFLCLLATALAWLVLLWTFFGVTSFRSVRDNTFTETRFGLFAWLTVTDRRPSPISWDELLTTGTRFRPSAHRWRLAGTVILALLGSTLLVIWCRRCLAGLEPPPRRFVNCPHCGYALHEGSESGCAECGWNRRPLS